MHSRIWNTYQLAWLGLFNKWLSGELSKKEFLINDVTVKNNMVAISILFVKFADL